MAYCIQADLEEQVSEQELILITDDSDLGTVDMGVITRAISDADAEIDSYCGTRHAVPFADPVPAMIRKLSVDLAVFNLFSRRQSIPEDRQKRYDNAIRFLRDVSRGINTLGADTPGEPEDGGAKATTSKADRVFTSSTLEGF